MNPMYTGSSVIPQPTLENGQYNSYKENIQLTTNHVWVVLPHNMFTSTG